MTLVAAQANPWGDVLDLECLHAAATHAVLDSVARVRHLAEHPDPKAARPMPLLLLGPAGAGKTHLFARLRRLLGSQAILVHIRPLVGSNMTPRYLLGQIMEQLGFTSFGLRQLDALVGALLARDLDGDPSKPLEVLEMFRQLPEEMRQDFMEHFLEAQVSLHEGMDESYCQRLLQTPFMKPLVCRAALAWLGGRDLDEIQAERVKVQGVLSDERVRAALLTMARLAATHAPLVLVFDQLENLASPDGGHVLAYGNLIAELVDVVRDVVVVQMAIDSEWEQWIKPHLPRPFYDRMLWNRHTLAYPTPEECEGLLRLWVSALPHALPYPWPFMPREAHALCHSGSATPRMLLHELRKSIEGQIVEALPADQNRDIIDKAWHEHLAWARSHVDERAEVYQGPETLWLLDGLYRLAQLMHGWTVGHVQSPDYLDLEGLDRQLRVQLLCQTHPKSVGSALAHLSEFEGPLLVLREQWREFKPTWKSTLQLFESVLARPQLHWHWLSREDAIRLLALEALHKDARSKDIVGPNGQPMDLEKVEDWIRFTLKPDTWSISMAIRSWQPKTTDAPVPESEPSLSADNLEGFLLEELQDKRLMSLRSLHHACLASGKKVDFKSLQNQLDAMKDQVRRIGHGLVCLCGDRR